MRRTTRNVRVGATFIGGINPVSIQGMTNTKTIDIGETINQTKALFDSGADIVRIAVPNEASVSAFAEVKKRISKPLVADIHFDYKLAIGAIRAGADKVRINPGNIENWDKVKLIIDEAKQYQAAIRIGVNGGSLAKSLKHKYGGPTSDALVESAKQFEDGFLEYGFENFVVSIKSSSVLTTIDANRKFASVSRSPLHLGVTETGTKEIGSIKSAIGIGSLLADGIGDTFRISLTADPIEEIKVALNICKVLGLRKQGVEIISCPTCGRTQSDLIKIVNEVEKKTEHITMPIKVAIMGCVVNGPGEAEEADIGLALGSGKGALFYKGKVARIVAEEQYVEVLLSEIDRLVAQEN